MKKKIKKSTKSNDITLAEAFESFIHEKEARNLSASTIRNYRQSYNYFVMYMNTENKEMLCSEIEQKNIFQFMHILLGEGVKPVSINHYLRDLRTFFYWCMDSAREYIEPPFKVEMVKGQEETLKLYTDEEQIALIEKPSRNANFGEWRTWAIVNWILATGNRQGSVINIKLQDLNFTKREITLTTTKNKKTQVIPMSSALETVLKEYIRLWRSESNVTDYLFPSIGDEKLTTNALRHAFKRYCADRGVNKTTIHGLRHTFAREFILNDGNTFTLQRILGHKTLSMTERYVRIFSDDLKDNFDSYSPLDNLKKGTSRRKAVSRKKD